MPTLAELHQKKQRHHKITMLTAYDYPTAVLEDQAGIDVILIGDSLGTNVLGYQNETEVTVDDMLHHLKAVRRGVRQAYVLVDMPYHSHETPAQALDHARTFLAHGASGVKIEGWLDKVDVVHHLSQHHIEVCGHIGFNPQTHGSKARVFGRSAQEAQELIASARSLEEAGASMLVIEKVPEQISQLLTATLSIPTIGIGAGSACDGQVLVVHDILGMTPLAFKHAKKYLEYNHLALDAITAYKHEVESGAFPGHEHSTRMLDTELALVHAWCARTQGPATTPAGP